MEAMLGSGNSKNAWIGAGLGLAFVALASNGPYAALISLFDYDDVLRRPAGEVLSKFHAAGTPLVLAWWTFALCAVGFALAAAALGEALKDGRTKLSPAFTIFGVLSGVLQAMALFRWTFAIAPLATEHAATPEGSAERIAIETTYTALNGFAGVNIGEHLGQILLMVWTLGVGLAVMRLGGAMKWIGIAGLATLPFWIVGQTELLATAIPEMPVIEAVPYAYIAWEVWLLVLGIAMVAKAMRKDAAFGTEGYASS